MERGGNPGVLWTADGGSLGGLGAWASGSTGADFAGDRAAATLDNGAWTWSRQAGVREGGKGVISAREECHAALSLSGSRVLLLQRARAPGPDDYLAVASGVRSCVVWVPARFASTCQCEFRDWCPACVVSVGWRLRVLRF